MHTSYSASDLGVTNASIRSDLGVTNASIQSDLGVTNASIQSDLHLSDRSAIRLACLSSAAQCITTRILPYKTHMSACKNRVPSTEHMPSESRKRKTQLCTTYRDTGHCDFGEHCWYAHGSAELQEVAFTARYKQLPCSSYNRDGTCSYGHKCAFAHNESPRLLRIVPAASRSPAKRQWFLRLLAEVQSRDQPALEFVNNSRMFAWLA